MKPSSYWTATNTPLYSFIFTLPLLLIYEIGLFVISANDLPLLRNGADVLMRQILEMFGAAGSYGFGGTFLIGFIIAFLRQKKELEAAQIKGEYLLTMLFESIGWAILLIIVMLRTPEYLMTTKDQRLLQQVVLAVGAGIYEEFVFRVILITGFAYVLGLVLKWGYIGRNIGSVFLAAVLFSAFHFAGPYGEDPSGYLFFIRIIAGVFLGAIYVFRGFGIAAYTHTIYDLYVLVKFTTSD
jgi:hypothetical protein